MTKNKSIQKIKLITEVELHIRVEWAGAVRPAEGLRPWQGGGSRPLAPNSSQSRSTASPRKEIWFEMGDECGLEKRGESTYLIVATCDSRAKGTPPWAVFTHFGQKNIENKFFFFF